MPKPSVFPKSGAEEATSRSGSPALRFASTAGISRPVTRRAISMISNTKYPVWHPKL
jgi:hypothetical protein